MFAGGITLSELNRIGYKDACKIRDYVANFSASHSK